MTTNTPLESLVTFITSIKEKHLADILDDLLSPKEIQEFAERIEILRKLEKGQAQRAIAADLGISVTTVSRGSRVLQYGKQKIKKYL
jgi:Trp operon repressor